MLALIKKIRINENHMFMRNIVLITLTMSFDCSFYDRCGLSGML